MAATLSEPSFRFTVLGSGTAIPDPTRGPAGFLVQAGPAAWLIDGGSGTLGRCAAAGVDPLDLAGGLYTHRHPDHVADLLPLLFSFRVRRRTAPYPIYAADGFDALLTGLRSTFGHWIDPPGGVPLHILPPDGPGEADLGAIRLRTRPANHGAGALHLRLEHPSATVVLSGDTGPSEPLVELARGVDLLVCECAGTDDAPLPGHLWPSAIRDLVDRARPRQVWLTHLYPDVDPERALRTVAEAGIPVRHAADLDRFEAGHPTERA